jgi:sugar phosphate isomerase/epimerase
MLPETVKLGVVASAFSPDPRVAPGLARSAGFQGLQFDARSNAVDIAELSGTGRREFRQVLGSRNQELVGLRHDLGSKGLGPAADVDRELERLARVMDAATGLGAPLVCVDLGPLPEPQAAPEPPKPKVTQGMAGLILLPGADDVRAAKPQAAGRRGPAEPPDPAFVSQLDAALVELGRQADRTSTVVAFRSELSSLAALERALRAADCPWFGVDLDPASVLADAWDLDEVFSRLGAMVRHVRGRDAVGGTGARTRPAAVGRGDTDWPHLLANLRGADYAGWITVDPVELPDRQAAAAEAVQYFRSLR